MNPETFFENLDILCEAPNSIGKLRELILQLAFMGKLVPQDPNDEPASIVIERIKAEKRELSIKENSLPSIENKEVPFRIPQNWEWVRLGEVVNYNGAQKVSSEKLPDDAWILDLEDIEKSTSKILNRVHFKDKKSKSTKTEFRKGNVLYGKLRPYLNKVVVADEDGYCTTEIVPLSIYSGIDPYYLMYTLKRPDFLEYVNSKIYGTKMPRLGTDDARKSLLPLPPLAEQKRIVSKVDELMALCDKLEARRQKKQEIQSKLNSAALDRMLSAENKEEFEQYWQRICENFDLLYDNPENVEKLKQAILQLAVQGKLVEQNPEDEPASVLIEEVKETDNQFPEENLIPYVLPNNWIWVNASSVSDVIDPQPSHRTPPEVEGGVPYIGMGDIDKQLKVNFEKARKVSVKVFEEHKERYQLKNGDFIFGKIGTLGHPVKLPEPFNYTLSANIVLIQPKTELVNPQYIYYYMDSSVMESILSSSSRVTTHAAFGIKRIRILPVPLPSLNEQKRIVEKVEQFMSLCDELEAKLRKSRENSEKLMEAVVKGLLEGAATEKTELEKPIPLQVASIQLK